MADQCRAVINVSMPPPLSSQQKPLLTLRVVRTGRSSSPNENIPGKDIILRDVPPSTTVLELKRMIQVEMEDMAASLPAAEMLVIPVRRQRLIYSGRMLTVDDDSLGGDVKMKPGIPCCIHLVPLPEGRTLSTRRKGENKGITTISGEIRRRGVVRSRGTILEDNDSMPHRQNSTSSQFEDAVPSVSSVHNGATPANLGNWERRLRPSSTSSPGPSGRADNEEESSGETSEQASARESSSRNEYSYASTVISSSTSSSNPPQHQPNEESGRPRSSSPDGQQEQQQQQQQQPRPSPASRTVASSLGRSVSGTSTGSDCRLTSIALGSLSSGDYHATVGDYFPSQPPLPPFHERVTAATTSTANETTRNPSLVSGSVPRTSLPGVPTTTSEIGGSLAEAFQLSRGAPDVARCPVGLLEELSRMALDLVSLRDELQPILRRVGDTFRVEADHLRGVNARGSNRDNNNDRDGPASQSSTPRLTTDEIRDAATLLDGTARTSSHLANILRSIEVGSVPGRVQFRRTSGLADPNLITSPSSSPARAVAVLPRVTAGFGGSGVSQSAPRVGRVFTMSAEPPDASLHYAHHRPIAVATQDARLALLPHSLASQVHCDTPSVVGPLRQYRGRIHPATISRAAAMTSVPYANGAAAAAAAAAALYAPSSAAATAVALSEAPDAYRDYGADCVLYPGIGGVGGGVGGHIARYL